MNKSIKTTCPYCGVGCGVSVDVASDHRGLAVKGDALHPANYGRLCSKGAALADTVGLENRLLTPEIGGRACDWDTALSAVAEKFNRIIARYGPNAVAFYGSGQLLTEDYYVANKLMKGFIGSANMDTNSRLCMSSSVAGHKRAFGSDSVPGCYEDLELADLIVIAGANSAWCHPVIYQRIKAAKERNPELKIVVIDPRRTATCEIADLHLALAIGTDVQLWNGLLAYLIQLKAVDNAFLNRHTEGWSAAAQAAEENGSIEETAQRCRLSVDKLETFYRWFAENEKTVSVFSQGINQSSSGTDKVNALINCHLATGRIGKPGSGPFSLTGQPNAMGGREVGGLAHQLAAHMDFSNPSDVDRVARFWGSHALATQPGLPAVELFDALYEGCIKAVWIMGTNPVVSMPNADKVKQALKRCEWVVVSDCIARTDTSELAHVLLPAQGWSEKEGTVTNSERRISRQRALLPPAGDAMPDWWIISQVARRMGFEKAFAYRSPADIFREHAALSGFENDDRNGRRDFDISALASLSDPAYDQLKPLQWPVNRENPEGSKRMFTDKRFYTPSGKAQCVPVRLNRPVYLPTDDFPLVMNTGRIRDQWHTMTRTALSAKLNQHKPEPFVETNPEDAECFGLTEGDIAMIESHWGRQLARVTVTAAVQAGTVFVPMHWSDRFAKSARVGALVNPAVDKHSKQPELKHTPVRIERYNAGWYGFILARKDIALPQTDYRVVNKNRFGYRYELAHSVTPEDWRTWAKSGLDFAEGSAVQEYFDTGRGDYRAACLVGGRLESVVFIAPANDLPERNWLMGLFERDHLDAFTRKSLLTGLPAAGQADQGNIVCTCFNVGTKTIKSAIRAQGLQSVRQITECLKAGGNCGSCIPELESMLKIERADEPARCPSLGSDA